MMPSFIITTLLGSWMLHDYAWQSYSADLWLHIKLVLVLILVAYHFYCGHLVRVFAEDKNTRSDRFYRWLNELPTVLLLGIIILVVVKPL
jgi:putative membrane protein